MFDGLPTAWTRSTLGECLASNLGGGTPSRDVPSFWNGDIPWASIKDITSRAEVPQERITAEGLQNSASRLVPAGTNILALRMAVGSVIQYDTDVAINQDLVALIPTDQLDKDYLFYWLAANSDNFQSVATGTTVKGLRRETLLKWPILLPPLDEQRRIAEVLRSVAITASRLAELRTATENLLMLYRRLTFLPLFCDSGESDVILADICDIGRGFAFKSTDYVENGVLNFRVTNVGRPLGDIGEKKFLPNEFLSQFEEYRLCGGEIVLVMVGATVGKLGRVPEELCPALLNQNMWTLQPKRGVSRELLWHLAHILIEEKVHGAQGGAYSFLTKKDFLRHTISNMSFDALQPHVAAMSAIEAVLESLCQEHSALLSMQSTIADDLLSGRVRVPV